MSGHTPIQELFNRIENRSKFHKLRPTYIYYAVKRKFNKTRNKISSSKQRIEKGWAYQDVWDWNMWHARIVAESLEHYVEVMHGHPPEMEFEEYRADIALIAKAYRDYHNMMERKLSSTLKDYDHEAFTKEYEDCMCALKKANKKLTKHYSDIWD